MGTDCKSAAFQLRWFESTRAHQEIQYPNRVLDFLFCRLFSGLGGWIRTAAALSQKTAQKQPGGLFLAARLATSTRAHQKSFSVTTTLELFVLCVRETHECGWIRTASARRTVRRAKSPSGAFLDARLAQSTRAHPSGSSRVQTHRGCFIFVCAWCSSMQHILEVEKNGAFVTKWLQTDFFSSKRL